MPAPLAPTYSPAALAAAHTAFRDLLDAGAGAGSIKIRDAADVLLARVPLAEPCGTVNATTGRLTLAVAGRDESADASGLAAYGEFCDGNDVVHLSLPAQEGAVAAPGKIVLQTLVIVVDGPVEVVTASVG